MVAQSFGRAELMDLVNYRCREMVVLIKDTDLVLSCLSSLPAEAEPRAGKSSLYELLRKSKVRLSHGSDLSVDRNLVSSRILFFNFRLLR